MKVAFDGYSDRAVYDGLRIMKKLGMDLTVEYPMDSECEVEDRDSLIW